MPFKDKKREKEWRRIWETKVWRKEYMRKWRKTEKGIEKMKRANEKRKENPLHLFKKYKEGAMSRNLVFKLVYEEFLSFWQKPCFYCGDEIKTIGLDRVDNLFGYTKENIVSCCKSCNRMKSVLSGDVFVERCKKIVNHHK